MAGGDIKKAQFISANVIIDFGLFNRITGIHQINKIDAFDNTAIADIKARDDAGG